MFQQQGEHEVTFDMEGVKDILAGREKKLLEVLSNSFGVGLRWRRGNADGGRLQLHAFSDVSELLDGLQDEIKKINDHPQYLDRLVPLHGTSVDITDIFPHVIGEKGVIVKWLQRELGCGTLKTIHHMGRSFLEAENVDRDAVAMFESRLQQIAADPVSFNREVALLSRRKIHIFCDVTDILEGSKRDAITGEECHSIRLDARSLLSLVSGLRIVSNCVVIGSHPSSVSPLWERWRECGWGDIRIQPDTRSHVVDDCLHDAINNDIYCTYPEQRTLVLLTGDHRTNFLSVIEQALSRGWMIELWSWGRCPLCYDRFKATHPQHFVARTLNQHRQSLTYRIASANGNTSYGHNTSYGQNGGMLQNNTTTNNNNGSNAPNVSSFYNTHNIGQNDITGRSLNGNYNGNYRPPQSASDHHHHPPAVATPEEVAVKLHKYVCSQSLDRCITAFDLNQFYTKHPECRFPLIELGASVFCNQDCARHLLRWEHGSIFPGGGRVHALSEWDSDRQTSIFATPSPGLGLLPYPPQPPPQLQQQQSHISLTSGPPPLSGFDYTMNQNNGSSSSNNMLFDASPGLGGGVPVTVIVPTSTRRRGPADAIIPLSNPPTTNGSAAIGSGSIIGSRTGGYEDRINDSDNHNRNHNNFPNHSGTVGYPNGLSHIHIHSSGYLSSSLSSQMPSNTAQTETSSSLLPSSSSSSSSINNPSQGQLKVSEFECPISMDVMRDPVVTKYGDSFERSAIVDWLSRNENCPLTRRPLTTSDLFDNKGLKSILTEYHQQAQTRQQQAIQQKEAAEAQQQKELQLQQLHQLQQQVEEQIKGLLSTKSSDAESMQSQSVISPPSSQRPPVHPNTNFEYLQQQQQQQPSSSSSSSSQLPPPPLHLTPQPTTGAPLATNKDGLRIISHLSYKTIAGSSNGSTNGSGNIDGSGESIRRPSNTSVVSPSITPRNDEDEIIPYAMLCTSGQSCQKKEGCGLYHWPVKLCEYNCNSGGLANMCTKMPTGQCGFLHSQQMDFIIRDDYNKMVGIRKAGFATVPYGGKKPPGGATASALYELERGGFRSGGSQAGSTTSATSSGGATTGSAGTAGGWTSVGGGGASSSSTLDAANFISADDLCATGFFCKGGCGKIHWPNRMCSSDASCPRYPNAACSFLHTKQKKYIIMNPDGTIKGIKKIGFKTVLNEGKK